jgi:hypothetical protein
VTVVAEVVVAAVMEAGGHDRSGGALTCIEID